MRHESDIAPEFSVTVALDDLPDEGARYALCADEAARAGLAARFGLVSLDRLEAEVSLSWVRRDEVLSLSGRLSADVVQNCVVTLEPVRSTVEEEIDLCFARDIDSAAEVVDPDSAEPLDSDILDIGEVVAEELSLALDPYPRAPGVDPKALRLGPGATYLTEEEAGSGEQPGNRPFEVLAGLRPKH